MQLRCLHANAATFAVRDHDPDSDGSGPTVDVSGSIVALVAVETADADAPGQVADVAADRIAEMAANLGEQTVVLVPFDGLTDTPAPEATETAALDALADRLDGEVHRVPVGEPFAFDLDARGHPHANQAFEIDPPSRTDGEWLLLDDGDLASVDGHRLLADGQLIDRLAADRLWPDAGPPLAEGDYLLPAGAFLRDSLVDLATDRFRSAGALPVGRVPEESADSPNPHEFVTGESDFPLALYTANTSAPVLATAIQPEDALETLARHLDLTLTLLADLALDAQPVCRVDSAFLERNRDWFADRAQRFNQPLLVERRADADQPVRVELLLCAERYRVAEPTVWLEDTDERTVVRSRPLGDPTRLVAALARHAAQRDPPQFPTWLSPTQLRLIPLADEHTDLCAPIADDLAAAGVRVDIDDRDLPVSERLDDAAAEWVPYDAVIGAEDAERFGVTTRTDQREREYTTDSFAERIERETAGFPDRPRPLPRLYTDSPARFRARPTDE
ncbi:threonyl-tRNA synthetase editing domain-containing protein [Halovenus halobia]|uniref:threonyl-tRNA synthetase editing domain-containing protein n=1 Tax=Halovenus halobia TaxID=3396622 RepID=UPI003F571071